MDDLLREYLTETRENLSVLEADLVKLEQGPGAPATLANIFRLMHNIKGASGFLHLSAIESLAHGAEGVLACLRNGSLAPSPKIMEALRAAAVQIGEILAYLEREGREPANLGTDLVPALSALTRGVAKAGPGPGRAPAQASPGTSPAAAVREPEGQGSLRIGADRLDNLSGLVSEIAAIHESLRPVSHGATEGAEARRLDRLNGLLGALRDSCHDLRTKPVGAALDGLPAFVQALAERLGKKADLVLEGAEVRVAGELVETIKDPLVHMVRNAVDHGLETPEDRRAAGKPPAGRIVVTARAEPGRAVIEVRDDGRGLDLGRIRAKARALGLAELSDLEAMDEAEIARFVFASGLSTSHSVSRLSGRGVGMDIVHTNVERAGGDVEVITESGKGTKFVVTLPLREAQVPVLTLESGGESLALPLSSVLEVVRVAPGGPVRIERLFDTAIVRRRSRLLPLVSLSGLLWPEPASAAEHDTGTVAIVQAGTVAFGLLVDRVADAREATVMALPPLLAGIGLYAGGMELAGGTVALVLDPLGLASAAGVEATAHGGADTQAQAMGARSANLVDLLVLRDAGPPAIAVPLALVDRVEDIDGTALSCSGGETRVLSRGAGIPLLNAGGAWAGPRQGRQRIVVCGEGDRAVALLAGRRLDLVEAEIRLSACENRPASFGTVEIEGAPVEVIDPGFYLEGRREAASEAAPESQRDVRRVLLVDDNPFFRQFLPPLLGSAGYRVTAVDSAEHALELCEAGEIFDAILTDVDLPAGRTGDFTETVKTSDAWRKTPMVALSSDTHRDPGGKDRAPGFADTVGKFDRARLLRVLHDTLTHERGAA